MTALDRINERHEILQLRQRMEALFPDDFYYSDIVGLVQSGFPESKITVTEEDRRTIYSVYISTSSGRSCLQVTITLESVDITDVPSVMRIETSSKVETLV